MTQGGVPNQGWLTVLLGSQMVAAVLLVVQCLYVQLHMKRYSLSARSSSIKMVETVVLNWDMSQTMVYD